MLYGVARPVLFALDPETADLTIVGLRALQATPGPRLCHVASGKPAVVMVQDAEQFGSKPHRVLQATADVAVELEPVFLAPHPIPDDAGDVVLFAEIEGDDSSGMAKAGGGLGLPVEAPGKHSAAISGSSDRPITMILIATARFRRRQTPACATPIYRPPLRAQVMSYLPRQTRSHADRDYRP